MPIAVPSTTPAKKRRQKDSVQLRQELRLAWDSSQPITEESPAWKYLSRRIPGLKLEWLGPDVRCHPGMEFWHDGKMQGAFPVLLQRLVSSSRVARTLQRLFLTPHGDKVPFYDEKGRSAARKQMSSPDGPAGGAIRLNNARSRNLALTEDAETGYAVVAKRKNRVEVRSMLGCGNLANADIDWTQYDRIDIYADRDKFREMGKVVRIITPVEDGVDFCDIWARQFTRMQARKAARAARAEVKASMALAA